MAKPKASEAFRMVKFFQTASMDTAELTFALIRETMQERRMEINASSGTVTKRRKRGPNKPKVQVPEPAHGILRAGE